MRDQPMTGKELHDRRRALRVSLATLSEMTGISQAAISNFETGNSASMAHFRMFALEMALMELEKRGPNPRRTRKPRKPQPLAA